MLEEARESVIICRRETPEARKRLNASFKVSVSEEPGPGWAELHGTRRPTALSCTGRHGGHLVQGASLFLLRLAFFTDSQRKQEVTHSPPSSWLPFFWLFFFFFCWKEEMETG